MTNAVTAQRIPRPMNCFLAFRLEKQQEIVSRCPGANHRDISKIIAKWWKSMREEEKEPYRERARLAKREHAKRYPGYKYKPHKRPDTKKTRKYMRRSHDQFTSRVEANNRIMKLLYENPRVLEEEGHKIAIAERSPLVSSNSESSIRVPTCSVGVTQSDIYASLHPTPDDCALLVGEDYCLEDTAVHMQPTTPSDTLQNHFPTLPSSSSSDPTVIWSFFEQYVNITSDNIAAYIDPRTVFQWADDLLSQSETGIPLPQGWPCRPQNKSRVF